MKLPEALISPFETEDDWAQFPDAYRRLYAELGYNREETAVLEHPIDVLHVVDGTSLADFAGVGVSQLSSLLPIYGKD